MQGKNTVSETTFCSVREAAARSGLSVYLWRQLVTQGKVPFLKSGNKYYIDYPTAMETLREECNDTRT